MLLRRLVVALALAAVACEPGVPSVQNPSTIDYGVFEPTGDPAHGSGALIPLPNNLALDPSAIATQNATQQALLKSFVAQGGFPNDQEVPMTVDFVRYNIDPNTGGYTRSAPPLDVTSVNAHTLLVLSVPGQGTGTPVAYDPPQPGDYATIAEAGGGSHGELTLHKSRNSSGSRRFDPGDYVFAVRGGPNGVKTTDGKTLNAEPAMFLLLQDKDLTKSPDALALIPGNSIPEKQTTAAVLEAIRKTLIDPFAAYDGNGFPHREIATVGKFTVAPTVTHVETDPSAGILPLPSDFLLAPDPAQGGALRLSPDAAPAFGALGPGLKTLDGFSTTAMVLAQTSGPILASSVNKDTVFIVELGPTGGTPAPRRLKEINEAPTAAEFIAEPPPITSGGLSTVIGLQPAVSAPHPTIPHVYIPVRPFKEGTTYAVLITKSVKDVNGVGIGRSTLSTLLLGTQPLSSGGKSQVAGVPDAQAVALDQMRAGIQGAIATVHAEKSAITADSVAMAFTFRTQTMKTVATLLGALPYCNGKALAAGAQCPSADLTAGLTPASAPTVYCNVAAACGTNTIAAAFGQYGIDTTLVPSTHIGSIVDVKITTYNKLDDATGYNRNGAPATGAFTGATVNATPEAIPAVIATPAASGSCTPVPSATPGQWTTTCSAPLVIFRHGFQGGRGQMLLIADALAAKGFVVAAIDAAKHGDRAFCNAAATLPGTTTPFNECAGSAVCTPDASLATEGDAVAPGHCTGTSPDFVRQPVYCPNGGACLSAGFPEGTPAASGEFIISGNLFRTRDSLRQDVIDESQLIRVMAPNPGAATASLLTAVSGYVVDIANIYFVGQSLGAMQGTVDVAGNPRIAKAALNVGGGTLVDTLTNPQSHYSANLNALLAALHITTPAAYLQFVNVAKWVLDPADPINFADNLKIHPLASPIGGAPSRNILGQRAACDGTVPDAQNVLLYELAGLAGVQEGQATGTQELFAHGHFPYACTFDATPGTDDVPHGFLFDFKNNATYATQAQTDIASFLSADTLPSTLQ